MADRELDDALARSPSGKTDARASALRSKPIGRSAKAAGARAVGTGRWLAELLVDVAPRIPVRDLATLKEHHGGRSGAALAADLIRTASLASAAVGATAGALATLEELSPPAWLTLPLTIMTETVAVAAIEMKLVAELHEVYEEPVPGAPGDRAMAIVRAWAERRGVTPAMLARRGGVSDGSAAAAQRGRAPRPAAVAAADGSQRVVARAARRCGRRRRGQPARHPRPRRRRRARSGHTDVVPSPGCNGVGVHVGVLGGTGPAGRGLAARLASVGLDVTIGSRSIERAKDICDDLAQKWPAYDLTLAAGDNAAAAAPTWSSWPRRGTRRRPPRRRSADLLAGQGRDLDGERAGQGGRRVPAAGPAPRLGGRQRAGERAQRRTWRPRSTTCRPRSWPTSTIRSRATCSSAPTTPRRPRPPRSSSALIPGLRPLDAGKLSNAAPIEAFAAVLLQLNVRYKTRAAVRLTGIDAA